jgi:hypothetical protein
LFYMFFYFPFLSFSFRCHFSSLHFLVPFFILLFHSHF